MPDWLTIFGTVFAVVFLVELPDKTALTTVVLATRYRPLPVFAGVALAFVIQSVVVVFAGSLIAFLPGRPNWGGTSLHRPGRGGRLARSPAGRCGKGGPALGGPWPRETVRDGIQP